MGFLLYAWDEVITAQAEAQVTAAEDECEYSPPAGSDVCGPVDEDGYCFESYCLYEKAEANLGNVSAGAATGDAWSFMLVSGGGGGSVLLLLWRRMERLEAPRSGGS